MSKQTLFEMKCSSLKGGSLLVEDNISSYIKKIREEDSSLNCFLELNEQALDEAKNLDQKRKRKGKLGAFFGLAFAIKSVINVRGMRVSSASKVLETYKGTYDADIVKKIKEEDGIILGMLNCDEFANGSSGETSAFGKTNNPLSLGRIPGGSSSGSAAAVAAGFCDIAIGTDTGGSIRNPASHCGVYGIKPSYGLVSRYGLNDLSMSLDTIGPLAKEREACAYVLDILKGKSSKDSTSQSLNKASTNKGKLAIGIIKEFEQLIVDKEIQEMYREFLDKLKKKGYKIEELSIKHIKLAVQAYYPIVYTEFFSGTRKFDGLKYGRQIELAAGEEVLRRVLGGKEISRSEFEGAYYKKALSVKNLLQEEFKKAFKQVDIIIAPVTPSLPHKFEEKLSVEQMYAYDVFTTPINLAGICAGVVPNTVQRDKETIGAGLQVLANIFCEDTMFAGMKLLESLKES